MSKAGIKTLDASNSIMFIKRQLLSKYKNAGNTRNNENILNELIKKYKNEYQNSKNNKNNTILRKIRNINKNPLEKKLTNTENSVGKVNTSAMSSLLVAPKENIANKYSRFKKQLRVGVPEQRVLQQYKQSNPTNTNSNESILSKIRNNTSINTSPSLPVCVQAFNGNPKHYNGSNCANLVKSNPVNNRKTNNGTGTPLKFPQKLINLLQLFYISNVGKIEKFSASSFFGKKKGEDLILLLEAYNNAIDAGDNLGYLKAKTDIIIKINHIESKENRLNYTNTIKPRNSKELYKKIGTLNNLLIYMNILKFGSKYVLGRKEITKAKILEFLPNFNILKNNKVLPFGTAVNNLKIKNTNINI